VVNNGGGFFEFMKFCLWLMLMVYSWQVHFIPHFPLPNLQSVPLQHLFHQESGLHFFPTHPGPWFDPQLANSGWLHHPSHCPRCPSQSGDGHSGEFQSQWRPAGHFITCVCPSEQAMNVQQSFGFL